MIIQRLVQSSGLSLYRHTSLNVYLYTQDTREII